MRPHLYTGCHFAPKLGHLLVTVLAWGGPRPQTPKRGAEASALCRMTPNICPSAVKRRMKQEEQPTERDAARYRSGQHGSISCFLSCLLLFQKSSGAFVSVRSSDFVRELTCSKVGGFASPRKVGASVSWPLAKLYSRADVSSSSSDHNESKKYDLRLVMLDHYDSYTYNLYDMLASLCLIPPRVVAADAFTTWAELQQYLQSEQELATEIDGLILSPGPGQPSHTLDMGLTLDAIRQNSQLPILGVCLGHQALGHVYGANVSLAPKGPVHGRISTVYHQQQDNGNIHDLWNGVPQQLDVVRYHSLVVEASFSTKKQNDAMNKRKFSGKTASHELKVTAWCFDENVPIVMGLEHTMFPHFGVQFHPESIGTQHGMRIMENFCGICQKHVSSTRRTGPENKITKRFSPHNESTGDPMNSEVQQPFLYQVLTHKVGGIEGKSVVEPEVLYEHLYGKSTHSFWLDDSSSGCGHATKKNENIDLASCKFSILGGNDGPLCHLLEYHGTEHTFSRRGLRMYSVDPESGHLKKEKVLNNDILTHLKESLSGTAMNETHLVSFGRDKRQYELTRVPDIPPPGVGASASCREPKSQTFLPFEYRGGYVGYLGYDVRSDAQRFLQKMELSPAQKMPSPLSTGCDSQVPTACFLFSDRSLVYDHSKCEWYLIGVSENGSKESVDNVVDWMKGVEWKIRSLSDPNASDSYQSRACDARISPTNESVAFVPNRSQTQYQQDIAACHEKIRVGESYELCLTNQIEAKVPMFAQTEALRLYKVLRKRNPAPFSAFINWNVQPEDRGSSLSSRNDARLAICCSSPERFVSVRRRRESIDTGHGKNADRDLGTQCSSDEVNVVFEVEAKPIKGTCARKIFPANRPATRKELQEDQLRAKELWSSSKNRAENLMIVDLLRNDMSRVCQVGTVHVPKLMKIETYATVHQMVSTIRGTLLEDKTAVDVLIACFPGGSMTGAPKLRSMEILEDLERGISRGPYSGCLGYISLNGSMDMNIVIRTACLTPSKSKDEWKVSIGAGGAITALSESEDEYQEMLLKAKAIVEAVQEWAICKKF